MHIRNLLAAVCLTQIALSTSMSNVTAADNPRVLQSIQAAASWLEGRIDDQAPNGGVRSLAALALLKAEVPVTRPALADAIAEVAERCQNGEYTPGSHHVYQAGVEATLLADADPERYRAEVEAIVNYIVEEQLDNGSWDYPSPRGGDTSVVQYACLGLWAGERLGIEIPQSAWDQTMSWHISTQNSDGGLSYVPGTTEGNERGESSINLTLAGLSSMLIAARYSYPGHADSHAQLMDLRERRPETTSNRLGPLEAVDLSRPRQPETPVEATAVGESGTTVDIEQLKQFVQRAMGYTARGIGPRKGDSHYPVYYYYTMERMAALADLERIGNFPWFEACSNDLISRQKADGSWQINQPFPERDTAFVILFLTRSTAKILGRTIPEDPIPGGLMAGGRGLGGGDLTNLRVDGNGIVVQAQDLGPLDDMLASLSNLGDGGLDEIQRQIVEKVQIGDRDALIDNKERLVELVSYENPDEPEHAAEVRRTAVWALGRTNDLSLVRLLIEALDDVNYDVMLESRNALCWLARRPNGLGEANDPLEAVPDGASSDQRQAAIGAWHAEAFINWGAWYLEHRPYEDRGDEFEAWLLDRMSQL